MADSLYQRLQQISMTRMAECKKYLNNLKRLLNRSNYYAAIDNFIEIVNIELRTHAECRLAIEDHLNGKATVDEIDNWLDSIDDIIRPVIDCLTEARNTLGLHMSSMHLIIQMGTDNDPPDYSTNPIFV